MRTAPFVSPSEIERETGFGKDQLRKWRQRFGFPPAESTADGKAAYSRKTISQLLLIKRLLEAGFRPNQVVGKPSRELEKLKLALSPPVPVMFRDESTQALIEQLKRTDLAGFSALLAEERAKRTLLDFVCNTVTPLMNGIGGAWSRDEIDIHHEHLCSCCVERLLHAEILKLKPKDGLPIPSVLLFSLAPGERHLLGLLMIEAALAEQGARTINIGSDVPLNILKLAAISCKADVVALSFSFAYPARDVVPTLLHLRRLLPPQIQIWAGGAGLSGIRKQLKGVRIMSDIGEAVTALNELTLQHSGTDKSSH
ncbi:MAG: MerR family transcriptional regulator [Rhodoferax sp.]|nr:MerR family transcriptional regulator [Rhodoferax sp.]